MVLRRTRDTRVLVGTAATGCAPAAHAWTVRVLIPACYAAVGTCAVASVEAPRVQMVLGPTQVCRAAEGTCATHYVQAALAWTDVW